jgi:misacylated tRNA(Ala) deacylase
MRKMPDLTANRTELLFWENQNLREFEATIEVIQDNGLILDKTAFYPESGGQLSDVGQIFLAEDKKNKLLVKFVEKLNGKVIHHVSGKIPSKFKVGQKIIGKIDWERRNNLMKAHTSQHVLSAVLNR